MHTTRRCCKSITRMGWCWKSTNTSTTHTRTHTSTYIHHTGSARVPLEWVGSPSQKMPQQHVFFFCSTCETQIVFWCQCNLCPAMISMAMAVHSKQNNCCAHFPRNSIGFVSVIKIVCIHFSLPPICIKFINFHFSREIFPAVSAFLS